jgi:hypothetical protein
MRIKVHADLAAYITSMAEFNGFDIQAYANNLVERGIRQELEEDGNTNRSVRDFMFELKATKQPNFKLLINQCHEELGQEGVK